MPDLPTITVTTPQSERILAAFKTKFGVTTNAEAAIAYKQWLSFNIKKVVLDVEKTPIQSTADTQKATLAGDIDNNLLPPQ